MKQNNFTTTTDQTTNAGLVDAMRRQRHRYTKRRARQLLNFAGYSLRKVALDEDEYGYGNVDRWIIETATFNIVLGADGQADFDDVCDFIKLNGLEEFYADETCERQRDRARERRR